MSGKTTSPTIKHKSATATDPTYTTSGLVSCADILLRMYLDVFSFETVKFCTMFSIFICTSCGVMETLVWVLQAHVQSSVSELLNRVDASVTFSVFDILEVVVVVGAVVVVDLLEVVEVVCEDKTMFVV